MAIANPRIHVICGICGCNKMFKYEIDTEINDDTDEEYQSVSIICGNCGSLTGLDELMEERKNKKI